MSSPDISAASSSAARPEALATPKQKRASLLLAPGVLPGLTTLVILLAWEGATRIFAIPSFVLPSPLGILAGFEAVGLSRWAEHVGATLRVAMLGYGVSILVAVPLAIMLARSPVLSRALYPILVVVQSTPIVAVAPIIIVVMGAGDLPRIVITCLITFFPIVVSTTTGLMATPPELIELSKSLRAPAWREITQIRLPFAVPYIFSALKISITLAVIGAVVAEFVAAEKGVGYFIQFSTSMFRLPQAWAGLLILAGMSLLLFQAVTLIQKRAFPWSLPKDAP
jgi:NitT/TauT family transport system permease protein